MTSCIISFSGRNGGSCSAIAQALLAQYEAVRKKFTVVSNTGQDNFTAAFQYHTGDAPPDVLFLSARSFGRVSIRGDLMDSPQAREAVLRFLNGQEAFS